MISEPTRCIFPRSGNVSWATKTTKSPTDSTHGNPVCIPTTWNALGGRDGEWEHTYVLVHAECDYRSPATMQDRLGCNIRVVRFGNSSFVFEYVMTDDRNGRTVVEGQSVQVMYDYENRKVRPIDAEFRDRVRRFEKRPVEGIDGARAGPQRPGRRTQQRGDDDHE